MFEYKTRIETVGGCRFYEKDLLVLDYSYTGDSEIECLVDYKAPGFGILLAEDSGGEIAESDNVYIFKLGSRNRYQIISRQFREQKLIRDEYFLADESEGKGVDIGIPFENIRLVFRFEKARVTMCYAVKGENGINIETRLFEFDLPAEMKGYKLGFYSNAGNVLKFAAIKSECPANWISNIFNAGGGRINWIKNGFTIEECEYDCEVESQNNILPAGKYYFDFLCDNPDMKYYIYPSYMRDTRVKRELPEIIATKEDERKNILDYDTMSFELDSEQAVNIKFKGKYGTVKEIAVKKFKTDSFAETDFDSIKRESSFIRFELDKVKAFMLEAELLGVAESLLTEEPKHYIFSSGKLTKYVEDCDLELGKKYIFACADGVLSVNGNRFDLAGEKLLNMFYNIDAVVSKLVITDYAGEELDVLHQKTMKVTVPGSIVSPIIVTDNDGSPYELTGSFRQVIKKTRTVDIFNRYKELKTTKSMLLNDDDVIVAGVYDGVSVNKGKTSLAAAAETFSIIDKSQYTIDYEHNKIRLSEPVRNSYKFILVEYTHCEDLRYEFTPFARALFDLSKDQRLKLEGNICDVFNPVTVFGIVKGSLFFENRLYQVPDIGAVNSVAYCSDLYDELSDAEYEISDKNEIIISKAVRDRYDYLIADYLLDKTYAVNDRNGYYEVDIASSDESVKIICDADADGVSHEYSVPVIHGEADINDFVVLDKELME